MRVLIVSSGLKPDHFGGLPSHVEDLIRRLSRRSDVVVAYLNTGARKGTVGTHLSARIDLPCQAWDLVSRWSHTQFWNGTIDPDEQVTPDPAYSSAFAHVIDRFSPDIVHFHELTSVPVATASALRARGIRTLFTAQDYFALCPTVKLQRPDGSLCNLDAEHLDCDLCSKNARSNRFMQLESASDQLLKSHLRIRNVGRRLIRTFERSLVGRPKRHDYQQRRRDFIRHLSIFDRVLVTSLDQRLRFENLGGNKLPLHLLPLSRETFRESLPEPRSGPVTPGKLVFLAMNIVNPAKGLALLEETFAELSRIHPEAELHLYGMETGSAPGIRKFGPYDDSQLDEIVASADFGILPSIWPEVYGYVGPEMLSRGLPLIASRRGAIPDYVTHGENGLLFEPSSPSELLEQIRNLVNSPALRTRLWRETATAPRRFLCMSEHVARLVELYGSIHKRSAN